MAKREPIRTNDVRPWGGGPGEDDGLTWHSPKCGWEILLIWPLAEDRLDRCKCDPPRTWRVYAEGA